MLARMLMQAPRNREELERLIALAIRQSSSLNMTQATLSADAVLRALREAGLRIRRPRALPKTWRGPTLPR